MNTDDNDEEEQAMEIVTERVRRLTIEPQLHSPMRDSVVDQIGWERYRSARGAHSTIVRALGHDLSGGALTKREVDRLFLHDVAMFFKRPDEEVDRRLIESALIDACGAEPPAGVRVGRTYALVMYTLALLMAGVERNITIYSVGIRAGTKMLELIRQLIRRIPGLEEHVVQDYAGGLSLQGPSGAEDVRRLFIEPIRQVWYRTVPDIVELVKHPLYMPLHDARTLIESRATEPDDAEPRVEVNE